MGDVLQKKVGMEVTTEKWWWICVGGDDGGGHSIGATSPPTNHSLYFSMEQAGQTVNRSRWCSGGWVGCRNRWDEGKEK